VSAATRGGGVTGSWGPDARVLLAARQAVGCPRTESNKERHYELTRPKYWLALLISSEELYTSSGISSWFILSFIKMYRTVTLLICIHSHTVSINEITSSYAVPRKTIYLRKLGTNVLKYIASNPRRQKYLNLSYK
jgi:hypothetical protein